jgi:hypothetical protein
VAILLPMMVRFFLIHSDNKTAPPAVDQSGVIPIGARGILAGNLETLRVAATEADYKEMVAAAGDKTGITQMIHDQKIMIVTSGTPLIVIGYGKTEMVAQVRILTGEWSNKSGVVPFEFIRQDK